MHHSCAVCLFAFVACTGQLGSAAQQVLSDPTEPTASVLRTTAIQTSPTVDTQDADESIKPTLVTLRGKMTLAEAFRSLGNQAHVEFIGPTEALDEIAVDVKDGEFWPTLDQVLVNTKFYLDSTVSKLGELEIAELGLQEPKTPLVVCYDGPFRIAPIRCQLIRNYLRPNASLTRVTLGLHWEAHVQPVFLRLAMEDVKALADQIELKPLTKEAVINTSVEPNAGFAEFQLHFQLTDPEEAKISSLTGTIYAVIPSDMEKFQFSDLDEKSTGTEIRKGDLVVRFEGWTADGPNSILRLRLNYANDHGVLESFLSWYKEIEIELNDGMGTTYKPVGLDVTNASPREVSLHYRFAKDPADLNLECLTPTRILRVPIRIDLRDLILP